VSKTNLTEALIKTKLDAVTEYMRYRVLPRDLQLRVKEHYNYCWRRTRVYAEDSILVWGRGGGLNCQERAARVLAKGHLASPGA
jgi:hypothetical protein